MSFLSGGAGAGGSLATVGAAIIGGAAVAVGLGFGATQLAQNASQPDATSANITNVSQPNYAD